VAAGFRGCRAHTFEARRLGLVASLLLPGVWQAAMAASKACPLCQQTTTAVWRVDKETKDIVCNSCFLKKYPHEVKNGEAATKRRKVESSENHEQDLIRTQMADVKEKIEEEMNEEITDEGHQDGKLKGRGKGKNASGSDGKG